jgi:hypothetical protein
MSDPTMFDAVNWHPDEWRFYAEGTVIAGDDLGAFTFTAQKDGWYYVECQGLGNVTMNYMPPNFDPSWLSG